MVIKMARKLVFDVGINDADYKIQPIENNRRTCSFFLAWRNMIERCYSEKYSEKYPTYTGCSVCPEWLTFSNFKKWMIQQDWQGKHLDKDLLVRGNKIYSPETCVFVDVSVNSFLTDERSNKGVYPTGVDQDNRTKILRARCGNPITGKREFLGSFQCQQKAHEAWRLRKNEIANQLADLQSDNRVADALRKRYA